MLLGLRARVPGSVTPRMLLVLLMLAFATSACSVAGQHAEEAAGRAAPDTDIIDLSADPWEADCLDGSVLADLGATLQFTSDVDGDGEADDVYSTEGLPSAPVGGYVALAAGGHVTLPRGPEGQPGTPVLATDVDGTVGTELLVRLGGGLTQIAIFVRPTGCTVSALPEAGSGGFPYGVTLEVDPTTCGVDCGAWLRCLPVDGGGPTLLENGTFRSPAQEGVAAERRRYEWARTRSRWTPDGFEVLSGDDGEVIRAEADGLLFDDLGCDGWGPSEGVSSGS